MGFLRRMFAGRSVEPQGNDARTGGILAGLFAASEAEVAAWDLRVPTPPHWPAFEFKRLETVKLGTLESILTGRPYEAIDQGSLHNVVRDGGPQGPWIAKVRAEFVRALAALSSDRAGFVAAGWADTDEFKSRPSDQPDPQLVEGLTVLLPEMAKFASTAIEAGTNVYLLMSL